MYEYIDDTFVYLNLHIELKRNIEFLLESYINIGPTTAGDADCNKGRRSLGRSRR